MNKLLLLIGFLIVNSSFIFSQEIEVVSGLSHPLGIAIDGNDIFICEHGVSGTGNGFISKADLSVSDPIKENLITGLTYPRALCLVGDNLYFANTYLYKFNIQDANPTATQLLYAYTPRALVASGDELFISGDDRIHKINVNDENPTLNLVIDGIESRILAFALKDNELYFGYSNKVSKIDITDETPIVEDVITDLQSNVYSLAFYNDTLLIGMALSREIVKLNLDDPLPEVEEFMDTSGARQPGYLLVNNDDLYIAGGMGNDVFKVEDLGTLLSVEDAQPFIVQQVYPNPSQGLIYISGLKMKTSYELYNSNGSVVLKGSLLPDSSLDISNMSSGLYFLNLKIENKKEVQLKIVKE